ncbi:hypothetical protein [Vibrio kanaloae]|uniref:hypothetical protein n=1 Tax=Vibrio kanaloae TaxID=170673 RepID=UPI0011B53E6E|nr:hypothetical protein [Vibrio kanaloae]MCG9558355.1 hypothetical protein [Vibrio kanaloae]NOJ01515.1 hypothetical protein [Vibrio kanaloae]UIJ40938.1 hypothetical protein LWM38_00600 [Vibrio kanaloae]
MTTISDVSRIAGVSKAPRVGRSGNEGLKYKPNSVPQDLTTSYKKGLTIKPSLSFTIYQAKC